jgi:pectate lyase
MSSNDLSLTRFSEYQSTGPGANPTGRASPTRQLTAAEAAQYTVSGECSSAPDAVHVINSVHHIWFDHDDISDGSDGNLDITFVNTSGTTTSSGTAFTPPYAYTLEAASSVQAAVQSGAGPR